MIIEAKAVHRYYGSGSSRFHAVRGVDFSVERGELVAVLGVNGAGKTSFIELLEGMAPSNGGTIRVFGLDPIKNRAEIRRRTGIMLQDAGFTGDLTVRETLAMWAGTLSDPRPVAEAIELVGLQGREKVGVKALSGGERRRLDLAMAMLGRPDLLFMDEPTTGLDPASRRTTWNLVRDMLHAGTTVVMTTHYLEEAEALADRVVIMSDGMIRHSGTVAEIVANQPATISFSAEAIPHLTDLDRLPGLMEAPETSSDLVVLKSSDLQETLRVLLADAGATRLPGLAITSASLEQAFLSLSEENSATPAAELASAGAS